MTNAVVNESNAVALTHKPSMALRFVVRVVDGKTLRILQQMFVPENWLTHDLEWRDVPVSAEE